LKLKCVVVSVNDEEAFRHNLTENKNRKSTSPVDDAHNQRRLRDNFGWSDTKIAEFYQKSPSYITLLKKLLLLPTETQAKVHRGELALNAAALLVELTPEEQTEVLAPEPPIEGGTEATPPVEGGKEPKKKKKGGRKSKGGKAGVPSTGTIVNRVRGIKAKGGGKKKPNKGGGEAPKPTSRTSRSMAEVRRFFESLTGPGEKKVVRETAEFMLEFVNGKWVDDTAEKKFKELYS
jgi:ParB-like chromosome segregation protein Spo0J